MKEIYVTIVDIVKIWNHPILNTLKKAEKRQELCQYLLPFEYSDHPSYSHYFNKDHYGLSDSTLRMLVNGNRKSRSKNIIYLAHADFTNELISLLNNNEIYNNIRPRQSLYTKILDLQYHYPITKDHSIFTNILLLPDEPYGKGYQTYEKLRNIMIELLEINSNESIAYALMILILAGWLQWKIEDIPWLYNQNEIYNYFNQISSKNKSLISPLDDPHYMHTYHAYLYRHSKNQLFEYATLTIKQDYIYTNTATLSLRYKSGADMQYYTLTYEGHLQYSAPDHTIVGTLTNKAGNILQIQFYYDSFRKDMYYRQGIVTFKSTISASPLTQKIILTKKEVEKEKIPYIKGLLSMNTHIMIYTLQMLESFKNQFNDYTWYNTFNHDMYDYIYNHIQSSNILNLDEIYAHFITSIPKTQLIEILLALRSIDLAGYEDCSHYATFIHNQDIHELFK